MLDFGDAPQRIVEIVLTGGSCAGKTSALELVSRSLREQGHGVLTVPEATTMLATGGVPRLGAISRSGQEDACTFQRSVFTVQQALRQAYRGLAPLFATPVVVILYDRGELDGLAYHPHDCVYELARERGTTLDAIRDSYDAVIHLVTAADGAETAFIHGNNRARWDTVTEAIESDQRLVAVWSRHRDHTIIDNSTDFVGKMARLVSTVVGVIEGTPDSDTADLIASPQSRQRLEVSAQPV
jgi:predicted ATPase